MSNTRGFILVNALVLVAAMAAAAVFVLARAQEGRAQLSAGQEAAALRMALDAFEANAKAVLARDARAGSVDTLTDAWAQPLVALPLDGVTLSGDIVDQQGLFNVNWLAGPDRDALRPGFDRLMAEAGLSAAISAAIAAFLDPEGRASAALRGGDPPMVPRTGPVLMMDQLLALPQVSPAALAQLKEIATALPPAAALNINTASPRVLRAALPQLSGAQAAALLRRREDAPFISVEEMLETLEIEPVSEENPDGFDASRVAVASNWFGGRARAQIEGAGAAGAEETQGAARRAEASREVMILRSGPAQVDWRVTRFGAD